MVDFILAFFSSSENVTVKTLLKSGHIYQSYCKNNLAQFFGPPCMVHVVIAACIVQRTCEDCVLAKISFDCQWCSAVNRCSDGYDRKRQHWLHNDCHSQVRAQSVITSTRRGMARLSWPQEPGRIRHARRSLSTVGGTHSGQSTPHYCPPLIRLHSAPSRTV